MPKLKINASATETLMINTPHLPALLFDKPRCISSKRCLIPAKKWWMIDQMTPDIMKKINGFDNKIEIFEYAVSESRLNCNK